MQLLHEDGACGLFAVTFISFHINCLPAANTHYSITQILNLIDFCFSYFSCLKPKWDALDWGPVLKELRIRISFSENKLAEGSAP